MSLGHGGHFSDSDQLNRKGEVRMKNEINGQINNQSQYTNPSEPPPVPHDINGHLQLKKFELEMLAEVSNLRRLEMEEDFRRQLETRRANLFRRVIWTVLATLVGLIGFSSLLIYNGQGASVGLDIMLSAFSTTMGFLAGLSLREGGKKL